MAASDPWRIADVAAVLAALGLAWAYLSDKHNRRRLPPGPKPLPILGNMFDVPTHRPWVQYQRWAEEYGDVVSLSVLGQVIVAVNSVATLKELVFGNRASVLSGRPSIKFAEVTGVDDNTAMRQNDKEWREGRRIIDNHFRPSVLQLYQHVQKDHVAIALKGLVHDPTRLVKHIRHYTGSIILGIVYGYEVKESNDPWIEIAEEANDLGSRTLLPGALLVNMLPFLARLPPWMLGSSYYHKFKQMKYLDYELNFTPWEFVKDGMKKGTARQSLALDALAGLKEDDKEAELVNIKTFGVIFGAASDTTVGGLSAFALAMMQNPDVQVKARAEIDSVVGRDRLPRFEDRPSLPYVEAVMMEVLRWMPITPQGVPHRATEDIAWNNYCIPKDSIIIGNAWAILHDADTYPDPESFKPERFLTPEGQLLDDPLLDYAFGYGARRCPGRHLADATMWIFLVSFLAVLDISKPKNAADIPYDEAFLTCELIIHPLPFECSIKARDAQASQLIEMA